MLSAAAPPACSGAAAACAVDAEGKLTFLNIVGTQGKHPCYVSVSPDGKFVYAANYSEGTATVFAVDENGALKDDPKIVVHQGTGANPRRPMSTAPASRRTENISPYAIWASTR